MRPLVKVLLSMVVPLAGNKWLNLAETLLEYA
jgi:hypothetical protein